MATKKAKPAAKRKPAPQRKNPNGFLDPDHAWPMPDKRGRPVSDGVKQRR